MNYIDIFVCIVLVVAVVGGWKNGAIVEILSVVGIILGIWCATSYAGLIGEWLNLPEGWAVVVGFVAVLITVMLAVAIISRLFKKLFSAVGLGSFDTLLGVILSVCKYMIILSLAFGAFDALNNQITMVNKATLNESKLYNPIKDINSKIYPALGWAQNQISSGLEKL